MSTPNCFVTFYEKTDYKGKHRTFDGPDDSKKLSDHHWHDHSGFLNQVDDASSSLKTGSQSWVKVYANNNFGGKEVLFGPNSHIDDLSDYGINNDIASFQLFDKKPVDEPKVLDNFLAQYPTSARTTNFGKSALEFYRQDTHYRVYYPSIVQDDNVVNFSYNLDHIIGMGGDDHATVSFSMDLDGNFVGKISVSYDFSSGAYHVPKWVLDFIKDGIDDAAEEAIVYLDGAEIVMTAGLGTELVIPTDILVLAGAEILTIGVNHINDVIDWLFGLGDNGGTMYLSSIVAHSVARLVFAYFQERYGQNSGTLVGVSNSALADYFDDSWDQAMHNDAFTFHESGSSYRIYKPDTSSGYSKAGLIASVKMDAINSGAKDDYLSLLCTFDPSGNLFSAQGTVDIYGAPDDSDDKDKYTSPSSGTIAYDGKGGIIKITKSGHSTLTGYSSVEDAWRGEMRNAINSVKYVSHSKFSDALKSIPDAGYKLIKGLASSTTVS